MAREGAEAEGRRYVTEGRLVIEHVGSGDVRARCRGDGAHLSSCLPQRPLDLLLSGTRAL